PSTATYSVASNGHTTITAGPTDHPPNLYLYDLNAGMLMGTDANASTGAVEQQAAPPFSNATAAGPYFLGNFTPSPLGLTPVIGEGSLSGGTFSFTEDGTNPQGLIDDQVFSGTDSVGPNGRTAITSDGSVAYIVSPSKNFGINPRNGKIRDAVF